MFRITDTHRAATWLLDPRAPKVSPPAQITHRGFGARRKRQTQPNREPYLIEAREIKQHFSINPSLTVKAVDGISFGIRPGEVFGLVGESGCGKSTTARTLSGIYIPTEGEVLYEGVPVSGMAASKEQVQQMKRETQIIFQDSAASLNPRMTVEKLIAEPFVIRRQPVSREMILAAMQEVGLESTCLDKYPGQLSGGQRQRVSIARSIITGPRLIIADEPIASLDISIQAQIVTLFKSLQREKRFAFLFIAHDLSMVRYISDRIGVMLRGRLVELADTEELFEHPQHPYTKSLLSAIHIPDPDLERNKTVLPYDTDEPLGRETVEVSPGHMILRSC